MHAPLDRFVEDLSYVIDRGAARERRHEPRGGPMRFHGNSALTRPSRPGFEEIRRGVGVTSNLAAQRRGHSNAVDPVGCPKMFPRWRRMRLRVACATIRR